MILTQKGEVVSVERLSPNTIAFVTEKSTYGPLKVSPELLESWMTLWDGGPLSSAIQSLSLIEEDVTTSSIATYDIPLGAHYNHEDDDEEVNRVGYYFKPLQESMKTWVNWVNPSGEQLEDEVEFELDQGRILILNRGKVQLTDSEILGQIEDYLELNPQLSHDDYLADKADDVW